MRLRPLHSCGMRRKFIPGRNSTPTLGPATGKNTHPDTELGQGAKELAAPDLPGKITPRYASKNVHAFIYTEKAGEVNLKLSPAPNTGTAPWPEGNRL